MKVKLLGIIALAAVIGFSMTACDDGTPPGIELLDLTGNVTITPNTNVTTDMELTANYTGDETVDYQWKKGGANVGTNSNKFTPVEEGTYTVTVSATGYNSKTSEPVVVSEALLELTGDISITPYTGVKVNTELTAEYTGDEPVDYQWKKGGANVGTNSNKFTPTEAGSYTVTISATGYKSKTSAAVDVNDPGLLILQGTITITPGTGVTVGDELTANYTGDEDVDYQWRKDGNNVGTNSDKFTPTETGNYTVTVSLEGYNPKTSGAVSVSLRTLAGSIEITPSTNVIIGTELTANYTGNEEVNFHFQWKKGETNVGTGEKFTPTEEGSYTVTISAAGYNPKTSNVVDVSDPGLLTLQGTITITPGTGFVGDELTANYTGTESVNYQWKKDGADVGSNLNKFTPTEAGSYTVTVSLQDYNPKTSDPVEVSLRTLEGTIEITPNTNVTINTELTANYTGSEEVNFQYQWKRDGNNVGTNSDKFTPTETGNYTVTVSLEGYNPKTSSAVSVSLRTLAGSIEINPSTNVIIGTELIANYTGSEEINFQYQWKRNGANVGTNSDKFIANEEGSYTVTVSAAGYYSEESDPVVVSILTLLGNIYINSNDPLVEGVVLTANYWGGTELVNYQWKKDGINVGTDTTFTANEAGIYTVTVWMQGYHSKTSDPVTVVTALTGFTFTPLPNLVLGQASEHGYTSTVAHWDIGSFSEPVGGQAPYTYSLESGEGSTDNSLFTITFTGNLRVGSAALTEARTYSVRVRVQDSSFPAQTFEKVCTFVVGYPPAGNPSAAFSMNATIWATVANSEGSGASLADMELPWITLINARVISTVTAGMDVSSWFSPTVTGLSYKVKDIPNGNEVVVLEVTGTPTATSSAAVTVTIPANVLEDRNGNPSIVEGLTVSGNITYNIARAPEYVVSVGGNRYYSIEQAISSTVGSAFTITVIRDIELSSTVTIPDRMITLKAETDVTISRAAGFFGPLFAIEGYALFGNGTDAGNTGSHSPKLIIIGNNSGTLINVINQRANFILYNGVELRDASIAVSMGNSSFTPIFGMLGGVIAGCGTGVSVWQRATFNMTGGIIYGADGTANANGLSVFVERSTATFQGLVSGLTDGDHTQTFGTAP